MEPTNDIVYFFHCRDCIEELPDNTSPRDFIRVEVGFTQKGIQVWCVRHEKNVVHLDFLGQKVAYFDPTNPTATLNDYTENPNV